LGKRIDKNTSVKYQFFSSLVFDKIVSKGEGLLVTLNEIMRMDHDRMTL